MKGLKTLVAMTAMLALAASASAQPCDDCRSGGGGAGFYSNATETTVAATVDEVKTMPGSGMGGLHLILSTSSGPIEVHVGPTG